MKIQDIFARDIHRPINGVVKADQLDPSSVWQELDEFVVTQELSRHMNDLVSVLLSTIESEAEAMDKNGIWVSGFFGSGKSHFIKVLSYLMENHEHAYRGEKRHAIDFFKDKLGDELLFADLKKLLGTPADTILFNIDSKADYREGRDALLRVFLRVLNEKQGYSGDYPHIAHMERHLDEKGKLDEFHEAFERAAGASWLAERDAWEFRRDEVVAALNEALGQSERSVEAWIDEAEENVSLTPENFAKWVKRYLDRRGPNHRVMFLVDEVGQFIGNDTHLMLNLQTITEQLATVCHGRAWVVVTSQEDLDAVLGDLNNTKQHDFSKIQGRFKTRLSLSSANVDEVIQRRLLKKSDEATSAVTALYKGKHDILKNQLGFVKAGMTFKSFVDEDDFSESYPFAAYQFTLVQKVFESIRKAGATGLHLSQGERSTLDAFQSAAKQISGDELGRLAPFYLFYPSVEGFLDTAVKRTIDQAADNLALQAFDITVLKVLFLIRYIEELPGSVDNLATLCVDEIDADKLQIKKAIEESLARLEGETLIARNGDLYNFLTNEERDIGREIKSTSVPSGAEERELGKLLFEDILGDVHKHSYSKTGRDFKFTRLCDSHPVGSRIEGSLEVEFISPIGDTYAEHDDTRCGLETGDSGKVLIRLPDHSGLGGELRTYLQTEAYVKTKHTGSLPDSTKRILRDRSDDNRGRRLRIVQSLVGMLETAAYFACGQKLEISRSEPKAALVEAMEYLIKNSYPKMDYIGHLCDDPRRTIQIVLRSDDVETMALGTGEGETNPKALADLREYIDLCARTSKSIVLHELIEKRYGSRPYGWPELEVALLVARLAVLKEITLIVDSAPLQLDQAYDHLTSSSKQRKVLIAQKKSPPGALIKDCQALGKKLFAQQGPNTGEALFEFLRQYLSGWNDDLNQYKQLASTGQYPGLEPIQDGLVVLRKFVAEPDSLRFLDRFNEARDELSQLSEDVHDLRGFYKDQKRSWEALRAAVEKLSQNRLQLEGDPEAGPALEQMEAILGNRQPYELVKDSADLIATATTVNDKLVSDARGPAVSGIQRQLEQIEEELKKASADATLRGLATTRLQKLLTEASGTSSIAHLSQAQKEAALAFGRAIDEIAKYQPPGHTPPVSPGKPRRVLEVSECWSGELIETIEQAEEFVSQLRSELKKALADGARIQIK